MERPIEGKIVDVRAGTIAPGRVFHERGVVTRVAHGPTAARGFLVPGFVDAHIHVDSSLLCPSRFAEAVVPRGTTAVVTDPHEIANVLGIPGIALMREDGAHVPLRLFLTAPSCVPATPFETSGASIGPDGVAAILRAPDVVALGEVMDVAAALAGDPGVTAKIRAARDAGKPVDGHAPGLSGEALRRYAALGITTDHECATEDGARERHALGMTVMVREGSAARDLAALAPFARENPFFLVADDAVAPDLVSGHVDALLARAVALGIAPMHALRAATLLPAAHYGLPGGTIAPGRAADVVRVSDLERFDVLEVYVGGRLVARDGEPLFGPPPPPPGGTRPIGIAPPPAHAYRLPFPGPGRTARVRVIGLVPGAIVTESGEVRLTVRDGCVLPDPERDVLSLAVVNRYRDAPPALGFVRGLGLRAGAIASSVAHDAHNIVAAGTGAAEIARAVSAVIRAGGGLCLARGEEASVLPLPVAGLMSADPPREVASALEALERRARERGCRAARPFLALSFLSLLVIPRLRLGDRGLFDAGAYRFVDALVPGNGA